MTENGEVYHGTEPPGPGWTAAGWGQWVKAKDPDITVPELRVAVIGGGPGGLFATYILNQRLPDARVTIFEATDRLGGKMMTDRFSDGTRFESGVAELYEYLGPGGKDPLRLLIEDDLGLQTVNMRGGAVVLCDDILRDHKEVEEKHGKETARAIKDFHKRMAELMPLEKYANRWQPDNRHPWANKTFHQCLHDEIPKDGTARHYIKTAVHSDLATEPHTCNGLNGIKNVLMDNDKYMQLYHVIGGIERVAKRLAKKIKADVRKETRVCEVARVPPNKYVVNYRCDDDLGHDEFDCVLVAIPNHWLTQICWGSELLTEAIENILDHYDLPAHYLRVTCRFKSAWWEEHKIPHDFWMMSTFNGCCCYNEKFRWRAEGNVLSWLIAGQDALLLCSYDQDDEDVVCHLLHSLPPFMASVACEELEEYQVDRFVGSINAQPGGWPSKELRGEHQPEPNEHPGLFIVGDYLFDSTINAALISASTAVDCLLEHLGRPSVKEVTKALEQLEPAGPGL
jgi:monoamine oxidase